MKDEVRTRTHYKLRIPYKRLPGNFFFILYPLSFILFLLLSACGNDISAPATPTASNGLVSGTPAPTPVGQAGGLQPPAGPVYGSDGQITVIAPTATGENISGQIFWVKDNTIWQGGAGSGAPPVTTTDLGGKLLIKVTPLALAKSPALSPDGAKLAYAYSPEPEGTGGNIVIGQDIYLMDLKTGATNVLVKRDEPQAFLDDPYWSADSKYIYFDARVPRRDNTNTIIGETITINRVEIATGQREKLVDDAREPVALPNGKEVVYVSVAASTGTYDTYLKSLDLTTRQVKTLTNPDPSKGFVSVFMPRPSPDGQLVVFAGVGGPDANFTQNLQATPKAQGSVPNGSLGMTGLLPLTSRVAAPVAHGLPYDLWLIKPDGTGLKRLTTLYEDHTMPSWSSDGKKITFLTGLALYTIDTDGKNLVKKSDRGGQQAGFVWRSN